VSLLIDTSQLAVGDRAEAVQSLLVGATAPHDLKFLGPRDEVHARIEYWQLGPGVVVLQHESSGIAHTRSDKHIRRDGPERVAFVLHDGGPGSYEYDGRSWPLSRGAVYATHLNSSFSYARPGDGVARIVQVDQSLLDLPVEAVQTAAGRLVSSPLYALLRGHIGALCRSGAEISSTAEAASVGEATAQLARGLLVTTAKPADRAGREALNDYLVDRIFLFIEVNLWNPDLTADQIATAHHISVRYLHKLWSPRPLSLAETIMSLRLDAAQRQLAQDPSAGIALVAHRCGFADASHFSRRFRGAFGVSPRDWRHTAAQG
jgi:AraC-like DNA-binding protein